MSGKASSGKQRRPHQSAESLSAPDRPGLAARLCAQRLLGAVIDTSTSLDGLTDDVHGHPQYRALEPRDRSLVRAILSSALRHRQTIAAFVSSLLEKPLPDNAKSLNHVLHVAATQILFLDIPDHSAVDLAVESARADPRNARFASLVNALLRRLSREKEGRLGALLARTIDAPDWLIEDLQKAYGRDKAQAILAMHRIEAPIDFTVKSDPEGWADKLGGIVLPGGTVRVASLAASVPELPGFADGEWFVQDVAAALPARCLKPSEGMRVADLCAAPGGKTALLAMLGAEVTALDLSASRLKRLRSNLERLKLTAETHVGSLLEYKPDVLFDAVLLDAPCSSTGTIRRHPDVAWTKSRADVEKLADLQFKLLAYAATLVKPGGLLLFSNCSLLPLEGEALAGRAIAEITGIRADAILPSELPGLESLIDANGWLRSTPADLVMNDPAVSGMDGFFATRFIKVA
ncbi:MAG: RsmB/NOP family class I SAM-dependent RNA methyltransferase [Rhizobiaceae bacterium]